MQGAGGTTFAKSAAPLAISRTYQNWILTRILEIGFTEVEWKVIQGSDRVGCMIRLNSKMSWAPQIEGLTNCEWPRIYPLPRRAFQQCKHAVMFQIVSEINGKEYFTEEKNDSLESLHIWILFSAILVELQAMLNDKCIDRTIAKTVALDCQCNWIWSA